MTRASDFLDKIEESSDSVKFMKRVVKTKEFHSKLDNLPQKKATNAALEKHGFKHVGFDAKTNTHQYKHENGDTATVKVGAAGFTPHTRINSKSIDRTKVTQLRDHLLKNHHSNVSLNTK